MNYKRAQEILASHGVIDVLYQGEPVWIEEIIGNQEAIVSQINNKKQYQVSLGELKEA